MSSTTLQKHIKERFRWCEISNEKKGLWKDIDFFYSNVSVDLYECFIKYYKIYCEKSVRIQMYRDIESLKVICYLL